MLKRKVYKEEVEVDQQLELLGLSRTILEGVLLQGKLARGACTENDPRIFPGVAQWAAIIRALREILIPLGWTRQTSRNYDRVLSPDKTISIAVAAGNQFTGKLEGTPSTSRDRGVTTKSAIQANRRQLDLFFTDIELESKPKGPFTWILLHCRMGQSLHAELSLPNEISEDGYVTDWATRIILPPLPLDPNEPSIITPEFAPEPEFELKRKS